MDITEALTKAVPEVMAGGLVAKAYPDLLKPSVQEIGTVLGRLIHAGLAPLRLVSWSAEEGERWVKGRVEAHLRDVPPERISFPEPTVAVPALMALRYSMHQEVLREMYAKLLGTAMDSLTAPDVHPSFVEVIKQLTSDEARILNELKADGALFYDIHAARPGLKGFVTREVGVTDLFQRAECQNRDRTDVAVSNLQRQELAIFEPYVPFEAATFPPWENALSELPLLRPRFDLIRKEGNVPKVSARIFRLTAYGRSFCRCCVEKPSTPAAQEGTPTIQP